MSDTILTTSWYKLNRNRFSDTSKIIAYFKTKKDSFVSIVRENSEGAGEKFSNIMMKVSIVKLAMALVTLMVMTVLLITHLHVFDPITLQFSQWVTSPLICFIMIIVLIKFIGLSLGLTLTFLSIKNITFENARLRLIGKCKSGLSFFIKKKVQHQRA